MIFSINIDKIHIYGFSSRKKKSWKENKEKRREKKEKEIEEKKIRSMI